MKTVTLQIVCGVAGAPDYRIVLEEEDGKSATAELLSADVQTVELSPAQILARFDAARQSTPDLEAIGKQLGGWLVRGDVGARMEELRGIPMRVLLDVRDPDLAKLPWELMRSNGAPDFLSAQKPVARINRSKMSPPMQWPMKVLVVVGAMEKSNIGAEEEVHSIERVLHRYGHSVDRQILLRPSSEELFDVLADFTPHVMTFVGHASEDKVQKKTLLRFQGAKPWDWSSEDVALKLDQTGWKPSLVILNACHTADREASFRFSDAFINAGTPACIMMQGDVRGEHAGLFTSSVLQFICEGDCLEVAVAKARYKVCMGSGGMDHREWSLPVLSMPCATGPLFPKRPLSPRREKLALARVFRDAHVFADRRNHRRKLRAEMRSLAGETPKGRLVVISGETRSGKSHLAKWSLENFALICDAAIQYVPQAGNVPDNSVSLMRRICDGDSTGPGELPQTPFDAFHWMLNAILKGEVPSEWNGKPTRDERTPFLSANMAQYEHAIPKLYGSFCGALRALATQGPVVIVLDNFRDKDSGQRIIDQRLMEQEIIPNLLRPISEGKIQGVLMVVVMQPTDCTYYKIADIVPQNEWITVEREFPDACIRVCQELLWYPTQQVLDGGLSKAVDLIMGKMRLKGANQFNASLAANLWDTAASLYNDDQDEDDFKLRKLLEVSQMG